MCPWQWELDSEGDGDMMGGGRDWASDGLCEKPSSRWRPEDRERMSRERRRYVEPMCISALLHKRGAVRCRWRDEVAV